MRIKELRKEANLTQIQVAEALGVNQSTVCSWELGSAMPRAELLPKLAELFQCTIDALFGRDQNTA